MIVVQWGNEPDEATMINSWNNKSIEEDSYLGGFHLAQMGQNVVDMQHATLTRTNFFHGFVFFKFSMVLKKTDSFFSVYAFFPISSY